MAESIHAIYKKGLEKFNNQPVCLKVDGLLNLDDVDNVVLSRGSLEVRLLSDLTQVQTISDYSVQLLDNFWLYSYITKIINSQGVVLSYQLLPQKVSIVVDKQLRYDRVAVRPGRAFDAAAIRERDRSEIENLEKGGPIVAADYYILNNGTIADAEKRLDEILKEINF